MIDVPSKRLRQTNFTEGDFSRGTGAGRHVIGYAEVGCVGKQGEKQGFFELGGDAEVFVTFYGDFVWPKLSQHAPQGCVFRAATA